MTRQHRFIAHNVGERDSYSDKDIRGPDIVYYTSSKIMHSIGGIRVISEQLVLKRLQHLLR